MIRYNRALMGKWLWRFALEMDALGERWCAKEVGDSLKVLFWLDVWCVELPLKTLFPELFLIACGTDAWVAVNMQRHNGTILWNVLFIRPVHDWEMEEVRRFFEMYSLKVRREGEDTICWIPARRKSLEVKSYYKVLSSSIQSSFPWKSIWKVKFPPRVAFFVWTATFGKILTLDNLQKRNIIVTEWCYMCKRVH
jgi:hypothetical protein